MDKPAGPDVEFVKVTKAYDAAPVVHGIDLRIERGAFVALLGPSGCGKTTCLRMIGGFEQPTSGTVRIRGADMAGTPPYRRPVNMVFQHYALFPHMSIAGNVGYGLRQVRPRMAKSEIARQVGEALEMVRLSGYGQRRTYQLSGGQQQRVALARALVNKPAVLLLDEPLAALDKKLRIDMQIELQTLQRQLGITFVLVTHDQEEALSMSDRVCVMNAGRVVQFATPGEIYAKPANIFVADFVGKTNLLAGTVVGGPGDDVQVRLRDGSVVRAMAQTPLPTAAEICVSIRPEAVRLGDPEAALRGVVRNRIFLGAAAQYAIEVPGLGLLLATGTPNFDSKPGEPVALGFAPGSILAFPGAPHHGSPERTDAHV